MSTRSSGAVRGAAVLAVLASFAGSPAVAAQFTGTLQFIEPTGTVGPTDEIPIWVRFTLDPGSPDALDLNGDAGATPPFGLPVEYYPTEVTADLGEGFQKYPGSFVSVSNVFLNTAFLCSGTFTSSCTSGPPYDFDFNTSPPDTINFVNNFTLQPGASFDYLFGTFKPTAPVAEGTYYFYGTYVSLNVLGEFEASIPVLDEFGDPVPVLDEFGDPVFDEDGNQVFEVTTQLVLDAQGSYDIAATPCAPFQDNNPSCAGAFSRTVVGVVPVPGAAWLLGSALGLLGWRLRRSA